MDYSKGKLYCQLLKDGENEEIIAQKFGISLHDLYRIIEFTDIKDFDEVHFDEINDALNEGKRVSVSVDCGQNELVLQEINMNVSQIIDGAHIMTVTGINRYGLLVDSHGGRVFLGFDALAKDNRSLVLIDDIVD